VSNESARTAARLLAAGRVALGIAVLAAPRAVTSRWLGEENSSLPVVGDLALSLGARDLALGAVTLSLLDDPVMGPRAVLLCALVDGVDTIATVIARDSLPLKGVLGTVAIAGAATIGGMCVSHRLAHPA